MKKALIVTTVSGFVPQFEMNNVKILQKLEYEVHYASNFDNPHYGFDNNKLKGSNIICHQVDFVRSPFSIIKNTKAYSQLKKILKEESYQILHCHTPMGSVLARLAGRKYQKKGLKICYTAHGLHFYKGAPWRNWLFYYPVERWLAHYTNALITINEEDYQRVCKFRLAKDGFVKKINGIGVKKEEYRELEKKQEEIREQLGIEKDAFVFLSIGELSRRKNHQIMIKAFAEVQKKTEKKIYYLICGEGKKRKKLEQQIVQYSLQNHVKILGYQNKVKEFLKTADCFLFPSLQEGLSVALMEAMEMGLPIICSDIRGNRDLIKEKKALIPPKNKKRYIEAMEQMLLQPKEKKNYPNLKLYEEQAIKREMYQFYKRIEEMAKHK